MADTSEERGLLLAEGPAAPRGATPEDCLLRAPAERRMRLRLRSALLLSATLVAALVCTVLYPHLRGATGSVDAVVGLDSEGAAAAFLAPPPGTRWIFNYGSNSLPQLAGRFTPQPDLGDLHAKAATLYGWRRIFAGASSGWGSASGKSGVADVIPDQSGKVFGTVAALAPEQIAMLDRSEGVQKGLNTRVTVVVNVPGGKVHAELYNKTDPSFLYPPSEAYLFAISETLRDRYELLKQAGEAGSALEQHGTQVQQHRLFKAGEAEFCADATACTGNSCCADGSVCPAAAADFAGCQEASGVWSSVSGFFARLFGGASAPRAAGERPVQAPVTMTFEPPFEVPLVWSRAAVDQLCLRRFFILVNRFKAAGTRWRMPGAANQLAAKLEEVGISTVAELRSKIGEVNELLEKKQKSTLSSGSLAAVQKALDL